MEQRTASPAVSAITRWREELSTLPPALSEEEAIDRITALEELSAACAAAQARETLTLDMRRRNREAEEGVPSAKQGAGVGAEIGLARKVSRARGSALLSFSRSLLMDLPRTYAALESGAISEEKARAVVREVEWLPREKRRQVDERMADRLGEVGVRRLGSEVRALAQQADQAAAVAHLDRCTAERAVSVRPAPGNMAYLTALLPLQQAVAVYANLAKSAQSQVGTGAAGGRTRNQVMADLLVERISGQESAAAIPMEIHLVMDSDTLLSEGDVPAWLPGFGPIPAESARAAVVENPATVFLRRLYTRPRDGQLVGMDSQRREFTGLLRRMIVIRDGVCRTPWCDAPVRHVDHALSVASGGATSWENASALCAACNYAKERPGWRHEPGPEGLTVRTPTGHRYTVRNSPLLIAMPRDGTEHGRASPGGAGTGASPAGTGMSTTEPSGAESSVTAPGGAESSAAAPSGVESSVTAPREAKPNRRLKGKGPPGRPLRHGDSRASVIENRLRSELREHGATA
ncbi:MULTISPECIES: HNH endonuclease [Brevibacterium]|nr:MULTISPECIES: DUF222 domain-containing protein [Brevibacterium]